MDGFLMDGFLKEVTGFRSDFRELLDKKVDHILGMIADMQQQLQAHERANENEIKFDGCVPEIQFEQQTVILATDCEESEIVMPCSLAEFESRSEKLELMHEQNCTTVEEADFSTDETTKMQAQKLFDEMLESEMKVLCVTKTETVEMKTEIGESEVQPQRFARSFDSLQRVTCAQYLHIWANENHYSRVFNNRARVRWKEEPPGHLEYLCEAYYLKPFNLNVSLPLSSRIPHFSEHDSPNVFDVKTLMSSHDNMLTRTHERNCCLTYDYVTDDDAAGDPLKEWDLDLISMLGELLISRPVNSSLSHKDSLEKCVEHAKLWLANADVPIHPGSDIAYAGLREKLNKIMASDYYTTTPEIKAPVEVAAAAGNYTSFQVPVHGSMIPPVSMPVPVEGSGAEYLQEEEQSPNSHDNEIYGEEAGSVEELHQGGSDVENPSEDQAQTEHVIPGAEADQNLRDAELKEQHRKPYQNYRGGRGGGGRRGYSNGRGGRGGSRGGYQNGRGQFYDQPGGYQPRNNYNYRGRGGRGMGGNFNYHGASGNADHAQTAS